MSKYSDIIKIRAGKPAYSIEEEKGDEWTSFIPNEQFNNVLKTVLRSVRGNDIDNHKSFWINGTYGTGKSHAVAVITHLLCDPVDEISKWVDYEYGDARFKSIKDSIYSLRNSKRLLPVKLEGLNNLTHVSELAPLIQTKTMEALAMRGIEMAVATDYDSMIKHVEENQVIWDDIIGRNSSLKTIIADREMLLKRLKEKDPATLQKARVALREMGIVLMLEKDSLGNWLIEVQTELRKGKTYQGLLILWDEFTDVMEDAVGIPVLKELQLVAHKFMNEENDSFIFLISHPSAFNKLGSEATKQTDGRYHRMKYNMESVSAFKIMSRKFEIVNPMVHKMRRDFFYNINSDLLDLYTAASNDKAETREDLYKLYPLHPGTANLATHYATVIGSSSRSVFEFIGQNDSIREFLESEAAFAGNETITADYLWDYVLKVFQDDVTHYGAVTERFNTYKYHVENYGEAATAIFKAILLLNAFNNIAEQESVTPNEENIRHLFAGTKYESELDDVLEWLNNDAIIQRTPGGIFSVQFSALSPRELNEIIDELRDGEYRHTSQMLKLGDTAKSFFEKKYVQKVIRPYVFEFYSEDTNDSILKNKIKTAKRNSRPSDLYLALMYAKDNLELAHLRELAETWSKAGIEEDKELKNIVFIVVESPFGQKNYERFIEYMASCTVAAKHNYMDQANVHRDHATDMIKEWMADALRGNAVIWINGEQIPMSLKHLSSCLNSVVSPIIYPKGPDANEMLRTKAASTFWKAQVSKEIIRTFIFGRSKSELLDVNGVMKPIQYLIQDAIDENLEWKADMPSGHQFKAVYDYINTTIKNFISHGNTSTLFDFTTRFEELTEPPYGLSGNFASAAMVAFAMRPWINKIYDQVGKPRSADNLTDDIALLFSYWEKGKATNKLSFKFQTPQEGKLCNELIKLFKLNKLQGYTDISSMKDARYAITGIFIKQAGYPLWSLKYMDEDFIGSIPVLKMNDDIKRLIDNITAICEEKDMKNVQLVTGTLDLISRFRLDFQDIIAKQGSFRNGFNQFLLNQPTVGLQPEEIAGAYDYITKNLQSTVGYWTEEEVSKTLLEWRVAQREEIERKRREKEEAERRKKEEEERARQAEELKKHHEEIEKAKQIIGNSDNVPKKKTAARELIDSIENAQELRNIIDRVIDLGYEKILDTILNKE